MLDSNRQVSTIGVVGNLEQNGDELEDVGHGSSGEVLLNKRLVQNDFGD
jgi:hypothetical protein